MHTEKLKGTLVEDRLDLAAGLQCGIFYSKVLTRMLGLFHFNSFSGCCSLSSNSTGEQVSLLWAVFLLHMVGTVGVVYGSLVDGWVVICIMCKECQKEKKIASCIYEGLVLHYN